MRQAAHILRKDLRRLRWWLALWAALLAGRVLIATAWPLDAGHTFDASFLVDQLRSALGVATFVLFGILTARLVHDEPLVGLDCRAVAHELARASPATRAARAPARAACHRA